MIIKLNDGTMECTECKERGAPQPTCVADQEPIKTREEYYRLQRVLADKTSDIDMLVDLMVKAGLTYKDVNLSLKPLRLNASRIRSKILQYEVEYEA